MLLIPTLLCPKPWENMSGSETERFCSYCKKYVHNLEALSVSERLALLSSPAASICSRYQVAIRRPAKGREESYLRHLVKYGAAVAASGTVLITLWEMHDQEEKRIYYRTAAAHPTHGWTTDCPPVIMPKHYYCEHRVVTMGMVVVPTPPSVVTGRLNSPPAAPPHVDLQLDPAEIDRLIRQIKPPVLEPKLARPRPD